MSYERHDKTILLAPSMIVQVKHSGLIIYIICSISLEKTSLQYTELYYLFYYMSYFENWKVKYNDEKIRFYLSLILNNELNGWKVLM